MQELLSAAKEAAVEAALAAGRLAKRYFGQEVEIRLKSADGDLVTTVDHMAEEEILARIKSRFPEHQIRSEESGWSGVEGDWLWLIDPLDGTNNYAIGLPVYGVSLTLLYRKEPVLGVIYDSHLEQLYVAEKGAGACRDALPIRVKDDASSGNGKLTIGWIQGHQVQRDARARALKSHLEQQCKRVLRLWAPTIQWSMLSRGDLDGIVLYNSEGDDLYAGVLLAKEAGAAVVDFDGNPFDRMNPEPYLIACPPGRVELFMRMVQEGLKLHV
ncbi:inositol monophosphatase [Paenibacillus filicis]|uniref:Inositol monophosphatase n=1 Tax=Paenibacillus gyeongsangnamensis TaxID=3388067 RepID=A0ABT4QIR5_9BACL|nr:inositol monophosphatase [Paenibacillus filicis]MCZ8516767.1 inositol monophosphatase [Paenibacillus filicis]